jgi:hypothetical protein
LLLVNVSKRIASLGSAFCGEERLYGVFVHLIGSVHSVRAYVRFHRGPWCCGQGISTGSSPGQRVCVTLDMKSLPAFCMEEHAGCGSSLY